MLTLAGPAIAFLFGVLFFGIWMSWRTLRYLQWLAAAFFLFSIALLSHILLIPGSLGFNTVVNCTLYTAATLAFVEGNLRRLSLRSNYLLNATVAILVVGLTTYFYYGLPWLHGREYVMNFGLASLLLVMALRMRRVHLFLDRALFWTLLVFALQFFVRTILTMGPEGVIGYRASMSDRARMMQSSFWIWMNFSFLVFTVLIGLLSSAVIAADIVVALQRKAGTDLLTGLFNRRGFEEFAAGQAAKMECQVRSLILFDLDDFKTINDSHGHHAGDAVLSQIGSLLLQYVHSHDAAARLGGEEFAVLLCDPAPGEAQDIAERLRRGIANIRFGDGSQKGRRVTASFGVIELRSGEGLERALRRADALMYTAKRAGKNRVVVNWS